MTKVACWSGAFILVLYILAVPLVACTSEAPALPSPTPIPLPPTPPLAKVFELKYANMFTAPHHLNRNVIEPFIEIVNRESKGRIKITNYLGGVLVGSTGQYEAVVKGTADVSLIVPNYTAEYLPLSAAFEMPFTVPNPVIGTSLLRGPLWDKYLAKEYEKVKVLGISQSAGSQLMMSKKLVRTPADLKGLKIRISGGVQSGMCEGWGAIPVKLGSTEQYEGLQRGTIDGTLFPFSSVTGYRLEEVVRYYTELNLGLPIMAVIMNKQVWENLPRDLQLVIEYASKDTSDRIGWSYHNEDAIGKEALIKAARSGYVTLTREEMDKFKPAAGVAIDRWIADMKAKGFPGKEVIDLLMSQPELYGLTK